MMKKIEIKDLAVMSLLIALEIVLTRFLAIQTPIVRVSFSFIPLALLGMMYGPLYAGIGAAVADIIGAILFPSGAFFPGFTLTAFLTGVVYGLFLYKHEKSLFRICGAVLVVVLGLSLGLDSMWVQMTTGKAFLALIPVRFVKCLIMAPIQVVMIRFIGGERILALLRTTQRG